MNAHPISADSHSLKDKLMNARIIIWDKDETITGSINPNDTSKNADQYLPNVRTVMERPNGINIICSGCKTPDSELKNFDPEKVADKLKTLMADLLITAATFSPEIGGVACYLVLKQDAEFNVHKAHEEARYKDYIGEFKKPGIGTQIVIKYLIAEKLKISALDSDIIFIGDTWHDKEAAKKAGFSFVHANDLHSLHL